MEVSEVQISWIFSSDLEGDERYLLSPWLEPYMYWIGDMVGPSAGLDNYIDIIVSRNTTQFYAQYVQYISQLHVSAHFRPSSGCS